MVTAGPAHDERGHAAHRIEAAVSGERLWFASPDVELRASPEALAAAVAFAGGDVRIGPRVDPAFADGVRRADDVVRGWWGSGLVLPQAGTPAPDPHPARALCFSGGVDSFWTLLRAGPWDLLVFVRGYDIALAEEDRAEQAEASVRAVAAETGARAVVITTNLRAHPLWEPLDWERAHGAALAAVGHMLIDHAGTFGISASYPAALDVPWGTHPRLDPLWSSRALRVEHVGAELWKREKLHDLTDEPIVHRHLRVCWEHRRPSLNCSVCEKCVRTMAYLAQVGRLEPFETFDRDDLPGRVDGLEALPAGIVASWEAMAGDGLPPDLGAAVERLLERSR